MSKQEIEKILKSNITKESFIDFLKLKYEDEKISKFDGQLDLVFNPILNDTGRKPRLKYIQDINEALEKTKRIRNKFYKNDLSKYGLSQIGLALSCTDQHYRRKMDLTNEGWFTVSKYLSENQMTDLFVSTKCLPLNSAIIRPRVLCNSMLFFRKPCLEFWISLCQLVEAIVFHDNIIYLTNFESQEEVDQSFNSLFFKEELNEFLIKNKILCLADKKALLNQEAINNSFLKFENTINQILPEKQKVYELADLFNDAFGRMGLEYAIFSKDNLYKITHTDPDKIYSIKKDPEGELRDLSLEMTFLSLSIEIDKEIIYDPLATQNLIKYYEKGIAKKNYEHLKETIYKSLINSLEPTEKFGFTMDPLVSVILKRVQKNRKGFFNELLELRDSFASYRKVMNDYKVSKANLTIDELLKFRSTWADSIQEELSKNWNGKKGEWNFLEFLDISLGNSEILLTISVSSLLKTIKQGINSIIVRKRIKPFISITRQLKQIEISNKYLENIFNWNPKKADLTRFNKLFNKYNELISGKNYLKTAKKDFLQLHGDLTKKFSKEK